MDKGKFLLWEMVRARSRTLTQDLQPYLFSSDSVFKLILPSGSPTSDEMDVFLSCRDPFS
jgi:hypothetical protein